MSVTSEIPPRLSSAIVISPVDREGFVVVKNQVKRTYLRLGEQETFLLCKFDGQSSYGSIIDEFETRFGESISCDDIQGFVDSAKTHGLLTLHRDSSSDRDQESPQSTGRIGLVRKSIAAARKQSILYFRVPLFDPDKTLDWLSPINRWLFSVQLAMLALVLGAWAMLTFWLNCEAIALQVLGLFSWQALGVVFLTAMLVTVLHEFGHGLACKKFGGEVREMGFLWLFFTPCFYCNVSDAWLLPSRWNRFIISAAGTYVDFLIWILSVAVWRTTVEGTLVNLMALAVVSTCGIRVFFNINPLMRLDGYYALCDALGQHNLRRRSRARLMEFVRWILWGAPRPKPIGDGTTLLTYGVVSWLFIVPFIAFLGYQLTRWLNSLVGIVSIIAGVTFVTVLLKRYFRGTLGEEFGNMLSKRKMRLLFLLGIFAGIMFIPLKHRVGGEFQVKPLVHWEVRAPIAGFLREIHIKEGDCVIPDQMVARIEVPELASRTSQKKSEIREVEAILNRLTAGPRCEEIREQKARIHRAEEWRQLAESDLKRATESLKQELASLDIRLARAKKESEYRQTIETQAQQLADQGGLAGRQLMSIKKNVFDAQSEFDELNSQKRARAAEGVISYEGEFARREKELADHRSTLILMEAGSRPEDIEAQQAKLVRLNQELRHLEEQGRLQLIHCPVQGTVITSRLSDKIGQYFPIGSEICIVEDLNQLEAEIAVPEQDAQILLPNQPVVLKPRSLPLVSIDGKVDRIASAAATPLNPAARKTVTVYCRIDNVNSELRAGMTGYGRVNFGRRPLGWLIYKRGVRLLRSEFWL